VEPARQNPPGTTQTAANGALRAALRPLWRLIILVVGSTVVLVGIAMLVLPGPAIVVIPAGLAILATEFAWARRLLQQAREKIQIAADAALRRTKGS
jgi:tellurite resistance protein TerC